MAEVKIVLIKHDNELHDLVKWGKKKIENMCCLKMMECSSKRSRSLYVMQAAFNGFS